MQIITRAQVFHLENQSIQTTLKEKREKSYNNNDRQENNNRAQNPFTIKKS